MQTWAVIFTPKGVPEAVQQKLNAAINTVLMQPGMAEQRRKLGSTLDATMTPAQSQAFVLRERDTYRPAASRVKPEKSMSAKHRRCAPRPQGRALRIGICGFFIECNRWSPVTTREGFADALDISGAALGAELAREQPRLLPDCAGFAAAMKAAGPWEPVPLRMAVAQPGWTGGSGVFRRIGGRY